MTFKENLSQTTNKFKEITDNQDRVLKVYALVRYLKLRKKKYLKFLIIENQYLIEKLIFYQTFEDVNAVVIETFEYCVSKTDHFPSSAFRALNLMPSEYSKYYMEIIVDILEYSLQDKLGLLFNFLLAYKHYTVKITNYISLI